MDAQEQLKVGDPITTVTAYRGAVDLAYGAVLNVFVHDLEGAHIVLKVDVPSYVGAYRWALTDEGLRWIRGHHQPDAPIVRALLAADALIET